MEVELKGARDGFTLVEVIVALVLLSVFGVTIAAATGKLSSAAATDGQYLVALDLVNDRLATIQGDPAYLQLRTRYHGKENTLTGFPGLARTTTINRSVDTLVTGRLRDVTTIGVAVEGPGLKHPVSRTISRGAP